MVGDAPCLAARVTYVGELGWELYASSEFARSLWDALLEAGRPHGMVPAGYRAIDSLRLEKGYRAWGADITPEDTPLEAGLGFAVRFEKDFLGRDALETQRVDGVARRLRCLVLDDERAMCLGNEPVFDAGGRRRPGHLRRDRLRARREHRVRLPPRGHADGRGARGRGLRRARAGGRRRGPALRPEGRADQAVTGGGMSGPANTDPFQ